MLDPDSLKKLVSLRQDIKMEGQRISALKTSASTPIQAQDLVRQLSLLGRPAQLDEVYLLENPYTIGLENNQHVHLGIVSLNLLNVSDKRQCDKVDTKTTNNETS